MIHSMLEIPAVELRAQGNTTHQMVHHTDATRPGRCEQLL